VYPRKERAARKRKEEERQKKKKRKETKDRKSIAIVDAARHAQRLTFHGFVAHAHVGLRKAKCPIR
jgi:acetyl-CoA carboxylase alpha subunit